MTNEININSFTGMDNISEAEGFFVKKGVAQPRIILNADVSEKGRLSKRDGYTSVADLSNGHSMWAGSTCHLVMDGTTLKRLTGDTLTTIENIGGLTTPMSYSEVGDLVYISNKYANGIFDPDTDSLSAWGITLPVGPVLSSTSGSLPIGTYHVCFTQTSGEDISGNGPISQLVLTSEGGISISNRPSGALAWCTEPNGDIFYRIGETDAIASVPTVEPLPSLFCSPPPFLEHITHAFGRMWGMVGPRLYYSEPFHLDWFKRGTNFFDFATPGTMVAKVKTGLFIGFEDRTKFLLGTNPSEMQESDVGPGAIPGTLAYSNDVRHLGDTISPTEKKHVSVPIWVSEDGLVVGNVTGKLYYLSQQKVKFAPGNIGASLYRKKDGNFQFLTTFPKGGEDDGLGMSDEATVEVIRNGVVI